LQGWFSRAGAVSLLYASLLYPCFAGKAKIFVGEGVDFASYKTYQWVPPKVLAKTGIVEDDPLISPIIKAAVNRELTARGLKEVAEGGDLQVVTCALNAYIPQLESMDFFPWGVPYDFDSPVAALGRYNREGTLAINLIDTRTNKSAWAGLITESIDNKPGAGAKKIPKATETLFRKFSPEEVEPGPARVSGIPERQGGLLAAKQLYYMSYFS